MMVNCMFINLCFYECYKRINVFLSTITIILLVSGSSNRLGAAGGTQLGRKESKGEFEENIVGTTALNNWKGSILK